MHKEAAASGQSSAPQFGPREQRRLGERLGLEGRVAEGGDADQAGPGGLAGGGIEQVVREPAVRVCQSGRSAPTWRSRPKPSVSDVRAFAREWVLDLDVERPLLDREAADPDVPSAVDDEAPVVAEMLREQVGGQSLAGAHRCRRQRRGAGWTTPSRSST